MLAEQFAARARPLPAWRARMDRMARVSCAAYQSLVGRRTVVDYFRRVSPEVRSHLFLRDVHLASSLLHLPILSTYLCHPSSDPIASPRPPAPRLVALLPTLNGLYY